MSNHKFTGLAAGTQPGDSVRYEQLFAGVPSEITGDTTLDSSHIGKLVTVSAASGAVTITMPSAGDLGNGAEISIVKSDQSANFVTINSVDDELLGYPSKQYSFHGTPATAVSDNGSGFVRVRMSEENRVFVTGDLARISGVVGFAALNADHVITRPTSASGVSATAIDLPEPYVAGYTSGGIVEWIQKSQQIRVCNGAVTYVSNGIHWVVKHATSDVWQGPKDFLFGERNSTYAGPIISGVGVAGAAGNLDAVNNAFGHRPIFRSVAFVENADPVDLIIGRMNREDGLMSEDPATSLPAGNGVGAIYGVGSTQAGTISTRLAAITMVAAEDITTAASGGHLNLNTTPVGETATLVRVAIRASGDVWLGGDVDRGSILADASLLAASATLSGSVNAADGDTVTIGGVTYTFESGALDAAYKVAIGATARDTLINLEHAINLTGTAGTTYGVGTAVHPTVHAQAGLGGNDTCLVNAKTQGAAGNAIAVSEASSYTWSGSGTLSGGEDAIVSHLGVKGEPTGTPMVTLRAGATVSGNPNIAMRLDAKGTAYIHTNDPLIPNNAAGASITTAGDVTLTAAQLIGGIIVRDCNGASRADTLPTAALLVAAIPAVAVGDTVRTYVVNGSDAAETITLTAGSGGSWAGAQLAASRVIPQNTSKYVHLRITNVTAASEAYVVYA